MSLSKKKKKKIGNSIFSKSKYLISDTYLIDNVYLLILFVETQM